MLGQGIGALVAPAAATVGWRVQRHASAGRGFGVAGFVVGAFATALAILQAGIAGFALAASGADPTPPVFRPLACDCAAAAPDVSLEIRLDAPGGVTTTVRGGTRSVALEPEPIVSLADIEAIHVFQADDAGTPVTITLGPAAASRLAEQATPGRTIAILVNGACLQASTVREPLPAQMALLLPTLTPEEACALHCAGRAKGSLSAATDPRSRAP